MKVALAQEAHKLGGTYKQRYRELLDEIEARERGKEPGWVEEKATLYGPYQRRLW